MAPQVSFQVLSLDPERILPEQVGDSSGHPRSLAAAEIWLSGKEEATDVVILRLQPHRERRSRGRGREGILLISLSLWSLEALGVPRVLMGFACLASVGGKDQALPFSEV